MHILIALDSFKDSISSLDAAQCLKKGLIHAFSNCEIDIIPFADGGEGTVDALVNATNGTKETIQVHDPLMRPVEGFYGVSGDKKSAFIEMAAASGIERLTSVERNPYHTTTYGTGELINDAIMRGFKHIIVGIGGSATNDAGVGMAQALGGKFLDGHGNQIKPGGLNIRDLYTINLNEVLKKTKDVVIEVACDVDNPLTGKNGASHVYGPQKGADEDMVRQLDKNLKHLAHVIKKDLKIDIEHEKGSGAAGGLGGGLLAFLNAELKPGFDIIKDLTNLEKSIQKADYIITGEGKIDEQTQYGKTPYGVASLAKKNNKKVIAVAGTLGDDYTMLYNKGFDLIMSIMEKPQTLEDALKTAPDALKNTGIRIGKILQLF